LSGVLWYALLGRKEREREREREIERDRENPNNVRS
jgi:hypothetical protein